MKSNWKVTSNFINEEKMYAVYRIKDINKVDNSSNREYLGGYMLNKDEAKKIADEMNSKEENK